MNLPEAVSRFLVVTPNVIVGEDLKETLSEHARAIVDVYRSLDDRWAENYALALFDTSPVKLLSEPKVKKMHEAGTQVVLLDGGLSDHGLEGTGILALSQPFATEDIIALLRQLGVAQD